MNYLAKLKAEFSEKALPSELTKPTKAPSVSFVSDPSRHISEIEGANEPLPDPAMETRRQRVLAMLTERPGIRYAVVTDTDADPTAVIVTLGIRGQATCELRIPRSKWDPFLFLEAVEQHSVH